MKKTVALLLALVFALGAVLVFMGRRGQAEYAASGFSAESGYAAISALSGDVSEAWEKRLRPELDALPEADRALLADAAQALLTGAWEAHEAGAGEKAEALASEGGEKLTWKLLSATFLTNSSISEG